MPDQMSFSLALPYLLAALAGGYLLGSIPFGVILTRMAGLGDVRTIGSGNIGATNVLRTGRKGLAAATLVGDALKGTTAVVLFGHLWGPDTALVAGFGAFLGHLFPVWLKFRGGKGVATYIGILLGLFWPAALIFAGMWIAMAWLTRYSSLSALVASAATPVALVLFDRLQTAELFAVLTVLLFIAHRANIGRLMRGEETRIGGGPAAS
ncbi:acyl-phosphate glycerol-3-phosphate acyltransferase [Tepidamorphus gemmatus]|jgi:glycerol-3-phosphate acyltransferase PlsY|uniref:Glycerol-3-phosphate acyltransferase n=1 Tax=Tepidamorphus gemmatus TaxID=747076 RepID=A0A4R3MCP2_9HYPH|nr:glycerol-3-phosphate 1-O-acyltransferase PlsY [Tepidamorphus gemmatus]TCT11350.1 acyl-phosphate glycerol-3-phosphate acyltransferase [Tepidamorphus gemmatus]